MLLDTSCRICDMPDDDAPGYAFASRVIGRDLGITFAGAPSTMPPAISWSEPLCRSCLRWWHDSLREIITSW